MDKSRLLVELLFAGLVVAFLGCSDAHLPPLESLETPGDTPPGGIDRCWTSNEGCACESEGVSADCGRVEAVHGDYVTCSPGTTVCRDGRWSECTGSRYVEPEPARRRALSLGEDQPCAEGFDPCDPYCNHVTDLPGGFEVGPGFLNDPTGLTLVGTGFPDCSSLTLVPSATSLVIKSFDPVVTQPAGNVTFTLTVSPPECMAPPFATTWTVDKVDRASMSGDDNQDGALSVAIPISGPITVTAYALGLSASTTINVKVNALDAKTSSSAAAPNTSVTTSQASAFGAWNSPNLGTTASTATWLYPYDATYFPLGLPAPVVQYRYSTTSGTSRAVKVSLRYPVNKSATNADFNYSLVVGESNVLSQTAGIAATNLDPQVIVPQNAWSYFEQTARGQDAELIVQRLRGSTLENEKRQKIHFVDGQLKGDVYYNSYTSPIGGNTGAVLRIAPGATAPTLAVQPKSSGGTPRCTVCHTINSTGTLLIANGRRPSGGVTFNNSRRYDISDVSTFPEPPVLDDYNASGGVDTENVSGNRFTFGAPWVDGSMYLTHGGRATGTVGIGDSNWRAPPDYSKLYKLSNPSTAVSVSSWPSNALAVTPRFSPDGARLAFSYWGGDALPKLPSGTISSNSGGTRMAVVDFKCSSPPCTGTSTGWNVSNTRDITPTVSSGTNSTSGTVRVAWPSFTPEGNAVVYQRQYRTSRSVLNGGVLASGWSPSDINTVAGALAEIWMSDVPSTAATAAKPTRLLALNGLTSSGTSYLPQDARTVGTPLPTAYHRDNGSFTITQADSCTNTGVASSVYDYRLNYLPNLSPVQAGNMNWVIFTSRRMYGNVAYDDPWDAEPGYGCNSGNPPTKKLWVAALDKNWTPGTDPSHPAFYLPGQELKAGNSDAYWVASECLEIGEACTSNDDCCGGIGDSPTTSCKVVSTTTVPPSRECQSFDTCSGVGQACADSGDCCEGLVCPPEGGVCFSEPQALFEQQVMTREYEAECPVGTHVEWRFFEWQATIPSGTSIEFAVQSRTSDGTLRPTEPQPMSGAYSTTTANSWAHGAQTASEALEMADPPAPSREHLLVTFTFNPSNDGSLAPTLHAWRQLFDCLPAE